MVSLRLLVCAVETGLTVMEPLQAADDLPMWKGLCLLHSSALLHCFGTSRVCPGAMPVAETSQGAVETPLDCAPRPTSDALIKPVQQCHAMRCYAPNIPLQSVPFDSSQVYRKGMPDRKPQVAAEAVVARPHRLRLALPLGERDQAPALPPWGKIVALEQRGNRHPI